MIGLYIPVGKRQRPKGVAFRRIAAFAEALDIYAQADGSNRLPAEPTGYIKLGESILDTS